MANPDLTSIVAIWAAVVSTILGIIRADEYLSNRKPRVKVSFNPTCVTAFLGGVTECCEIRAVNRGRKPVTIEALVLQLSDGGTFNPARLECYSRQDLPVTLTEGQGLSAFLRKDEIHMEKVTWAFARAVDGTIYKSKLLKMKDLGIGKPTQ